MPVSLEIQDGNPWWLSPNVWTVPGNNPEGSQGMPIAGEPCYVWARIANNGSSKVDDATVRFYWANPAVGFNRTTANLIGTSYISLDAGETADVLCLVSWIPDFINQGHLCVLAEAFHPSLDPLPATNEFNVPNDRHVAQRNITVINTSSTMFRLSFEVHNTERKAKVYHLRAKIDKLARIKQLHSHFGRNFKFPNKEGKVQNLGFMTVPCPKEENIKKGAPEIKALKVKPGQRLGLTLTGNLKEGAILVHIEQVLNGHVIGGLSALVISGKGTNHIKPKKGEKK